MFVLVGHMRLHFDECVAERGLTPPQAMALLHLDEPTPMGGLAGGLSFDASYITDIADQLETKGLMERRTDPSDRRRKILALTAKGELLREDLLSRLVDRDLPAVAGLSGDERRELADLLTRVVSANEAALELLPEDHPRRRPIPMFKTSRTGAPGPVLR